MEVSFANYHPAMRVFPSCGEGFRRLSVVAAILVALGTFSAGVYWNLHEIVQNENMCLETYAEQNRLCYGLEAPGREPCEKKSIADDEICRRDFAFKFRDVLPLWCAFAIAALVAAYLIALALRTVGWVAHGFGK